MVKELTINKTVKRFWLFSRPHLPSVITLAALCTAFSSIFCALNGKVTEAILAVWFGGFLDALDGRVARYLNACSKFGAEIDSLADLVSFGVSPALVIYLTQMKDTDYSVYGWISSCAYVCCMAVRLARFNVTHDDAVVQPNWTKQFFKGVPAPAGSALLFAPLYLEKADIVSPTFWNPQLFTLWECFVAVLLVSNLRTFSGKGEKVSGRNIKTAPFIIFLIIGIVCLIAFRDLLFNFHDKTTSLFLFSSAATVVYISSFPFSHLKYLDLCSGTAPPLSPEVENAKEK